jgi:hypothetical protein
LRKRQEITTSDDENCYTDSNFGNHAGDGA